MYCTLEHLSDRYGERLLLELTDRAYPPSEVIDVTVVSRAIADASAMMDAHLKARYALPMAAVPDVLIGICCEITIYKLHGQSVSDKFRDDYKLAMDALTKINRGDMLIEAADVSAVENTDGVETNGVQPLLKSGAMKGFI